MDVELTDLGVSSRGDEAQRTVKLLAQHETSSPVLTFDQRHKSGNTFLLAITAAFGVVGTVLFLGSSSSVDSAASRASIGAVDVGNINDGGATTCFEGNNELKSAVHIYLRDNTQYTEVAIKYGWPIGAWCVSKIQDFSDVFSGMYEFDEDISNWDTSNAITMKGMFRGAKKFDHDISTWDTSSVENMEVMFSEAERFNQDISVWKTSKVKDMSGMFHSALSFNRDISTWDTSNVNDMNQMFYSAISFSQDISSWDTSSVTIMRGMFWKAKAFNRDLSSWDVSKVVDMDLMFTDASEFRQDLCAWGGILPEDAKVDRMLDGTDCEVAVDPSLGGSKPGPFCFQCA